MDIRKLDLNLLITLEALLSERNVTKAAARLGLSQPAVSAQLVRLRGLFADQLLIPAQRGMTPTQRALELQGPLRRSLDGVRDVVTQSGTFDPATAELTVVIASTDLAQYAYLVAFAIELRLQAPNIRLVLRGIDSKAIEKQTENGDVDLGILLPNLAPPSMRLRKFTKERFVLVARKRHPRVRGAISLKQFLDLDHVIAEPRNVSFSGAADSALQALGHQRRVVLSVASFLIAADIVAHSDLIAILPMSIVADRTDRLQILEPPIKVEGFPMALVWHERTHSHAGHRWLRDALAASANRKQNGDSKEPS